MKIELTDANGVTGYNPALSGSFIVVKPDNNIYWMGRCRVEFEWNMKYNKFHNRVGFKKENVDILLVKQFWNEIFKKLGAESKFTINESNISNLYVIDLPAFWNGTDTGRSLFSLLLRGSLCYYDGTSDVISTMNKYPLAKKAILAIEWFLKGNTVPTYDCLKTYDCEGYPGFVAEFEKLKQEEIEKKLVSKK